MSSEEFKIPQLGLGMSYGQFMARLAPAVVLSLVLVLSWDNPLLGVPLKSAWPALSGSTLPEQAHTFVWVLVAFMLVPLGLVLDIASHLALGQTIDRGEYIFVRFLRAHLAPLGTASSLNACFRELGVDPSSWSSWHEQSTTLKRKLQFAHPEACPDYISGSRYTLRGTAFVLAILAAAAWIISGRFGAGLPWAIGAAVFVVLASYMGYYYTASLIYASCLIIQSERQKSVSSPFATLISARASNALPAVDEQEAAAEVAE